MQKQKGTRMRMRMRAKSAMARRETAQTGEDRSGTRTSKKTVPISPNLNNHLAKTSVSVSVSK